MKLLYGSVSPFVRKVTVTLHELGLAERVDRIPSPVSATEANPNVVAHNPVGKIPTLILDNGESLYDSIVICEYLAHLAGDSRLFPAPPALWRSLRLNALADGVVQAGVLARNYASGPTEVHWETLAKAQWAKVHNCLSRLEVEAAQLAAEPTIGEIAVACAVGWVDFRVPEIDWRAGRSRLASWFEQVSRRPSLQMTVPKAA